MRTPRQNRIRTPRLSARFAPGSAASVAAACVAILAACGSRSEIAGASAGSADAGLDAAPEATPRVVQSCTSDTDCTTDTYCFVGSCAADGGCVALPRGCDDGVSCTRDTCSESTRSCAHTPDDSLCPDTQLCSPRRDCDAFVYTVGVDNHLYETRVPSGQVFDVGVPAAPISDVALAGSVLYATDSYILYRVARATAVTTTVASILPLHQYNGLGSAPDGSLLATADVPSVFRVDPMTGVSTPIATLPAGYRTSGDVTTWTVRALVPLLSLNDLGLVSLAELPATGAVAGPSLAAVTWRDTCLYGMATLGGVVYGFDCNRAIFTIDPQTGAPLPVGQSTVRFIGGAGR